MKINVRMRVAGQQVAEATLEIDDYKLEELTEEEVENAIEIVVSTWANRQIEVDWESEEETEEKKKGGL